jgi:5-methylcytosine-specific restriction protein A
MPARVPRLCPSRTCPGHVDGRTCTPRRPWGASGSAEARGYGAAWQRTARRILKRDAGLCYVCRTSGATQVDHVVPRAAGGTEDDGNLAAIHASCHRRKTAAESAAGRWGR